MFDILLHHNTLVLFGIIFFGIALGSIKIYGLNLGLSGVLFVALAAGHYRLAIPDGVGQLGLALFVYCVGLSAGNRFFSAIAKQGSKLAIMSAVIVGVSALFTCLFGIWFKVPAGISSGIFAGACTSTPALAAATESLPGASGSGVSIGYGIAYPFGVVGVVLFVQLLPRLLRFDLNKEAKAMHSRQEVSIISRLVRVTQPNLIGQNIADCKLLDGLPCHMDGHRLIFTLLDGECAVTRHTDGTLSLMLEEASVWYEYTGEAPEAPAIPTQEPMPEPTAEPMTEPTAAPRPPPPALPPWSAENSS